ncbi:MAG: ATP-binding protein, partial [Isosphaerales bacterium]
GTKEVLILETTQQTEGPYTFDGRPYQRIGNTTSRMPQAEYQRRLLARVYLKHRWENQPAERYSVADLDLAEVERTHRIAIDVRRLETPFTSPLDTLDRLQLRRDGLLLQAAVVLFGKKQMPDYPQCALRMARFRGTTKDEFIDQRQIHGHAFDILEEADLKRDHPSRPRNPLIAEPFYLRSLIEKWGRGTQRIVTLCRDGRYPDPEFLEAAGAVTVRFPTAGYHAPTKVQPNLTERQRRILSILSDGRERSFPDLFVAMESPPSARTVQAEMRVLRDLGFIDSRGRGKSARWWLKEGAP